MAPLRTSFRRPPERPQWPRGKDPLLLWLPSSTFRVRVNQSATDRVSADPSTAKANGKPWMRLSAARERFRCGQIFECLSFLTVIEFTYMLQQECVTC